MNISNLYSKLTSYLSKQEEVVFALVYGSFARGTNNKLSDIDIGIFFNSEPEILEYGKMISDLEGITGYKIDLLKLNNLFSERPKLAFEIVNNSKLMLCKNNDTFIDFKTRSLLYYFDIKPMLDNLDKQIIKRIKQNRFGVREDA